MRNAIFISVLLILAAIAVGLFVSRDRVQTPGAETATPSATETYQLEVDGVEREFIVYRPKNLSDDEVVPVVFMFHGGGQNGKIFYESSGWKEKADEEGFMVVFPTALKYHVYADTKVKHGEVLEDVNEYATRWTGFNIERTLDPDFPDQVVQEDLTFVLAMRDFLNENYAVDLTRFYATGFSNGAGFVNRLMVVATDIFAAFAGNSSGGLTLEGLQAAEGYAPDNFVARPSIVLLGSEDPKLTYGAGAVTGTEVTEFTVSESAMDADDPIRVKYIDPYLYIQGLMDTYAFEDLGRVSHFTFSEPNPDAVSSAEYNLYIVDGMKHVYPNGDNYPVVAVDIYWPFFEQFSL